MCEWIDAAASASVEEEVARKVHARIRAAIYGQTAARVFARADKSRDGRIGAAELTGFLRKQLKIAERDLSDREVRALVTELDDDGSGELSIPELVDFLDRGSATFNSKDALPVRDDAADPVAARAEAEATLARALLEWLEQIVLVHDILDGEPVQPLRHLFAHERAATAAREQWVRAYRGSGRRPKTS